MKFGVFYNPMVPKDSDKNDWEPGTEKRAFDEMLEQIRFADSLGFDYAFLGEHHFMPEYAHNSATEVLLGALAATTKNIRLGTGITHASHNDPVRTAERIAMIDQITGGRAEFGFGPGTPAEVKPLIVDDKDRYRDRAAASAQISVDVLGSPGVWAGASNEFFSYPPVDVVPKSFQQPHPPLWTSVSTPGIAPGVAERGLGMLMLTLAGADVVASEVAAYWDALQNQPVKMMGRGVNPAVFAFTIGLVAPTPELANERAREGLEFFGFGLTGAASYKMGESDHHLYNEFRDFKAGNSDVRAGSATPPMLLEMGKHFADLPGTMMTGPEGAREFTRKIEAAHVDGLLLNQQFGTTKHEHLMESIEIWGTQVIPEFREREAEHQEWRRKMIAEIGLPVVSSV